MGLKSRFLRFRRELVVVAFAVRHPDTPWALRLGGVGFLLYLATPLDLIPIFVPVAGLLDDLILVPWGLARVVERLPAGVRVDAEARAERFIERWIRRPLVFLGVLLLALFLVWGVLLWLLWRAVTG